MRITLAHFYRYLIFSIPVFLMKNIDNILISAAGGGNIHRVEWALRNGANVNACGSDGMTALMTAASFTDAKACELLINNGADLDRRDVEGYTAIDHSALTEMEYIAEETSRDCLTLLVAKGAPLDGLKVSGKGSFIDLARQERWFDVVTACERRLLSEMTCSMDASDPGIGL